MKSSSLKNQIARLSQSPGVYIFRDEKKKIIYVGKATDLKSRVGSYFASLSSALRAPSPKGRREKEGIYLRPIEMMIHQVVDIETQETDSVLEALILESNLIKKYQPKYNVKEKDDKSFSYFVITKEEFPRVLILRETELEKNGAKSRTVLGRSKRVSEDGPLKGAKIFGPYTSKKQMEIALKIMRKIFPFHSHKNKTERGCLDFQLGRCPGPYAGAISKADYAKNIRGIQMILEGKKKGLVGRMERDMQILAKKNEFEKAAEMRNKIFALSHVQDVALITQEFRGPHPSAAADTFSQREKGSMEEIFRVEAYDISNISGEHAVGSMVVFDQGEPNKKEYRKFKIKTVEGSNDVAMMREVLSRRFNNDWMQPDLILLDGGQGHLNMAEKLLHDFGFVIPLIAVAKGPSRKNLKIQISNFKTDPNAKIQNEINKIIVDKNLVKYIMDEAHRFAIGYHRKLRKREFI